MVAWRYEISLLVEKKNEESQEVFNFFTETMAQPLYKIPISGWFCIYSLERLILHPQYHHTSFLEPFLTVKEDTPISYFWRKSYDNPFDKKTKNHYGHFVNTISSWPAKDCFQAVSCTCISPNMIKKWRMRKFSFFFTKIASSQNSDMATLQKRYVHSRKKIVLYKE